MVVKFQAHIRGYLARKKVGKMHGFKANMGLMNRRTDTEIGAEKLKAQRDRVKTLRDMLPPFKYGLNIEEDNEIGVMKEKRQVVIMDDGSTFDGEWNIETNNRHGRGMQIW